MTTADLLALLRERGISLWVDGDALRYSAPWEKLTQDLREQIVEHKPELLKILRKSQCEAVSLSLDETTPELKETFVAPRTPTEEVLVSIWTEALNIRQVSIHDNFFELGGDSLLVLQVIAKARNRGLRFTPNQLLQYQTIAELAEVEGTVCAEPEQELVTGALPLLTASSEGLNLRNWNPSHHNLAAFLEVNQRLDPALMEQALQHVLVHHDGLRIYFIHDESGWHSFIEEPKTKVPFVYVDMTALSPTEHAVAIEGFANELHRSFKLSEGPLLRVAFFDLGKDRPGRLLVIVNHRVADQFSLLILLEDLAMAYQQLVCGEEVHLPPKTLSLRQWGELLNVYTQSPELRRELDYWLTRPWSQIPSLPLDYPEGKNCNTNASYCNVKVSLNVDETEVLVQKIPKIYKTEAVTALLMALVQSITQWTGGHWAQITVQDSGRSIIPRATVDLSRTVGNLTCRRLLILERDDSGKVAEAFESMREQLHRIPNRGLGYRLLRYSIGDAEVVKKLSSLVEDDEYMFFNYLGMIDRHDNLQKCESDLFRRASGPTGIRVDPRSRPALLSCTAYVAEGRFVATWSYSNNVHRRATIERVANDFIKTLQTLLGTAILTCDNSRWG
jgi:non-ribosomal peptide synthase protein (TIGR01720 family)